MFRSRSRERGEHFRIGRRSIGSCVAGFAFLARLSYDSILEKSENVASKRFGSATRIIRESLVQFARKRPNNFSVNLCLYNLSEKLESEIVDLAGESFALSGVMRSVMSARIVAPNMRAGIERVWVSVVPSPVITPAAISPLSRI